MIKHLLHTSGVNVLEHKCSQATLFELPFFEIGRRKENVNMHYLH